MALIAVSNVSVDGVVYPPGATLPESVNAERLLRLGVAKEQKTPAKRSPRKREASGG